MSQKYNFTIKFQKELLNILENSLPFVIKTEEGLQLEDIKAPVDLYLVDDSNNLFLIELEIHRADPSNNIAKIAYWLENRHSYSNVIVIQVFSPYYLTRMGSKSKKVLSEYLGKNLVEIIHSQRYYSISSEVIGKKDFEKLYREFKKGEKANTEKIGELKELAEDYAKQILVILNAFRHQPRINL